MTVLEEEDVLVELTGTELDVVVGGRVLDVDEITEDVVELSLLDDGAALLLDIRVELDVVELGLLDEGATLLLLLLLLLVIGAELEVDELMPRELRPPVLDEDETAATE